MPRLEIDEFVARVVTDQYASRPGLRDPEDQEAEKIRRFAARRALKHGSIGIGAWTIRGVGLVMFGLRRASLVASNWSQELPHWTSLARRCAEGRALGQLTRTDREDFGALASFLEGVQQGNETRASVESIITWTELCARTADPLAKSEADDARYARYEHLSEQRLLRDLWDFLWRTHVGTDHMPRAAWPS